ncbi:hypothetical protein VNI00_011478 [Paramarasmius palmivorus]|uniref:Uncharacterized protein n=1 Tax=Paramarasmius palmivorus TaxID=297713 RepID=A0AAW0CCX4_9AGAR
MLVAFEENQQKRLHIPVYGILTDSEEYFILSLRQGPRFGFVANIKIDVDNHERRIPSLTYLINLVFTLVLESYLASLKRIRQLSDDDQEIASVHSSEYLRRDFKEPSEKPPLDVEPTSFDSRESLKHWKDAERKVSEAQAELKKPFHDPENDHDSEAHNRAMKNLLHVGYDLSAKGYLRNSGNLYKSLEDVNHVSQQELNKHYKEVSEKMSTADVAYPRLMPIDYCVRPPSVPSLAQWFKDYHVHKRVQMFLQAVPRVSDLKHLTRFVFLKEYLSVPKPKISIPVLLIMTDLRRAVMDWLQDPHVSVPHPFFEAGTTFPDCSVDKVFEDKLLIILQEQGITNVASLKYLSHDDLDLVEHWTVLEKEQLVYRSLNGFIRP